MVKTLQIFNAYQQFGGEEATVQRLSELMLGEDWSDVRFESQAWAVEPKWKKISQLYRIFSNRLALEQVRRKQSETQAQIWLVHNLLPVGSARLYLLAAQMGVPMIQYLHNYRPFSLGGAAWLDGKDLVKGFEGQYSEEIMAGAYRGSRAQGLLMATVLTWLKKRGVWRDMAGWISQSQYQKNLYVGAGIDAKRIHVLLPPRVLGEVVEPMNDEGYVLFMGRLVLEKGVLFLIQAWREALASGMILPNLIVVGGGPLHEQVKKLAEGVAQVEVRGYVGVEEKERLIKNCSAVVVPSLWQEVLGLVAFEAYENEKPVLAARVGGLSEVVFEGSTGFTHEAGQADQLVLSVQNLMAVGPERRRDMGRVGRKWLAESTDPGHWRRRYVKIVEEVLEQVRSRSYGQE